jgi:PIN domain nuclease of toxin-antitoxin system
MISILLCQMIFSAHLRANENPARYVHLFLWFISGDTQLSTDVRDAIRDTNNEVYLSSVSVWETIVKYQLGKLPLPEHPGIYLPKQRDLHQIISLALDENSVVQLAQLPPLHRDPFDRMLICQALQNALIIATVDSAVRVYPVSVI